MNLTDFEWEILEECSGRKRARPWGAAVGVAIETLRSNGLVRSIGLTPAGWLALKERTSYSQPNFQVGNEGKKG